MMKIKFKLSILLNITLLFILFALLLKNKAFNELLNEPNIPSHSYIPKKANNKWDSESNKAYYMFINDNNHVEFKTFKGKTILEDTYTLIGNGVYKLNNTDGYLINKDNSFEIQLSKKNSLIFKEYIIFDK